MTYVTYVNPHRDEIVLISLFSIAKPA